MEAAIRIGVVALLGLGVWLVQSAASAGAGVLQFALSIVIAGVMLSNSEGTRGIVDRFLVRLAPETGRNMRLLAEQTVRGVATGVVGVAIVQSLLAGIGFYLVGIPGVALLALVCLLMGIIQLPLAIPILPVIIYVWTELDSRRRREVSFAMGGMEAQ